VSDLSERVSRFLIAQLGYTVPFTLFHAGIYRAEDKLKIQTIHKLNTNHQNNITKQDYPRPGNEMGSFYNTPKPTPTCWCCTVYTSRCIYW